MITRMELDPARQRLIYGFFESYLKLTEQEEEQLMDEVRKLPEADQIFEIPISYEEKGKEIAKKEMVIEMLKEGMDLKLIEKVSHLDIDEIKHLKQKIR